MSFQIDKLRSQADEQEATLLAQEEEVHGKQKELDRLKEEEKTLLEDIKKSEKEIERLELDLIVVHELAEEVSLKAIQVSLKQRLTLFTRKCLGFEKERLQIIESCLVIGVCGHSLIRHLLTGHLLSDIC